MLAAPDGILETLTVVVTVWLFNNLVPRIIFVLALVRGWMFNKTCCILVFVPVANTDENNLSDDDNDGGLLFEFDGDDTGFDGIFEEQ